MGNGSAGPQKKPPHYSVGKDAYRIYGISISLNGDSIKYYDDD